MRWVFACVWLLSVSCSAPEAIKEDRSGVVPTAASEPNQPATQPRDAPLKPAKTPPAAATDLQGIPLSAPVIFPGSALRLLELSPADANQPEAPQAGSLCAVTGEGLQLSSTGEYSGAAECGPQKKPIVFTGARFAAVALTRASSAGATLAKPRFTGASVGIHQPFTVLGLDPADAYFPRASEVEGLSCVVLWSLKNNGEDLFSGAARCGPKKEYFYFSRVSVSAP